MARNKCEKKIKHKTMMGGDTKQENEEMEDLKNKKWNDNTENPYIYKKKCVEGNLCCGVMVEHAQQMLLSQMTYEAEELDQLQ